MTEIPEEAREAAAKAACETAYPPSPTGRVKAHDSWDEIEEWERDAWRATANAAVAVALPHLRVQETPGLGRMNQIQVHPAQDAPAPRPVVDREAIWRALYDVWQNPKERPIDFASEGADAILALIPTEEGPSGQEHPQRSDPAATQDPEQASDTGHRSVWEPARSADAEELAQARPASGLTEEDIKGEGS